MQPASSRLIQSVSDLGPMIDVQDPESIASWSSALIVSPIELKQAAAKVGASSIKIRAYFGLSAFEVWPIQVRK
jgi:hypothetical protein